MSSEILLTPNYFSFGAVANNSITDTTASISNTGDTDMTVGAMTGLSSPFSLLTDLSGSVVGIGGNVDFSVRYNPTSLGDTNQTLTIDSDATNPSDGLFGVDGTSTAAYLNVVPSSWSFGLVLNNSTTDKTVEVSNSGNINLTVGTLSGLTAPYSLVNDNVSDSTIAPDGTNTLVLRYNPTSTGASSDTLVLTSNDPGSPDSMLVDGTSGEPDISASPTSLSFGTIAVGQSSSGIITVTNIGATALTMTPASGLATPFSITNDTISGAVISAGDSSTLTVVFAPTVAGGFGNTLLLNSDDPDTPSLSLPVGGSAASATPIFSTSRSVAGNMIYDYIGNF